LSAVHRNGALVPLDVICSSELDEMWSVVQAKAHPRWLWHAIDHHTGKVLAYVFGRHCQVIAKNYTNVQ